MGKFKNSGYGRPKMNASNSAELKKEVADLMAKLKTLSLDAKKQSKSVFRSSAKPLVETIQFFAPESEKPHSRWLKGKKVATYYPGNLARSFQVLIFNQSPAVFVGPKVNKTGPHGDFKGNRVDGYYAHWIEFGAPGAGLPPRPFVKPAVQTSGDLVLKKAIVLFQKRIKRATKKK